MSARTYEGVTYSRFVVSFSTSEGKRRRKVIWAPYAQAAGEAFARFIRYEGVDVRRGSNVIVRAA